MLVPSLSEIAGKSKPRIKGVMISSGEGPIWERTEAEGEKDEHV